MASSPEYLHTGEGFLRFRLLNLRDSYRFTAFRGGVKAPVSHGLGGRRRKTWRMRRREEEEGGRRLGRMNDRYPLYRSLILVLMLLLHH